MNQSLDVAKMCDEFITELDSGRLHIGHKSLNRLDRGLVMMYIQGLVKKGFEEGRKERVSIQYKDTVYNLNREDIDTILKASMSFIEDMHSFISSKT